MILLEGIPLRNKIREKLAAAVSHIPADAVPGLAIIQVGTLEASSIYVKGKKKFGEEIGVPVVLRQLPESASEEELLGLIRTLNADPKTRGILIQLPLPAHISPEKTIEAINPEKDVDGLHSANVKKLIENDSSGIVPATARGVLSLLDFYSIPIAGKKALVVGRSALVGKPVALSLVNRGATITIAHSGTEDLQAVGKEADIIVVAAGVPGLITKAHVREGQTIVDIGITKKDGKTMGDVAFDEVSPIVAAISPVPGGVGPLTVASLFQNLLRKYT